MSEGPRVVIVAKRHAPEFLEKARGFLKGAKASLADGEETSAGALAIHAGISAADALTVHFLGQRSAGQRHMDVLGLLERVPPAQRGGVVNQLRTLLSEKNAVEYDQKLLPRGDGGAMVALAERIVARVASSLR